jgi:hypothetical protein
MIYLSNAFSLQMQGNHECVTEKLSLDEAKRQATTLHQGRLDHGLSTCGDRVYCEEVCLSATSCVGHADIAAVLSSQLGVPVPTARISIALCPADILIVGQYIGPRLPEGCTALPDGAKIDWYSVTCQRAGTEERYRGLFADIGEAAASFAWPGKCEEMLLKTAEKYFPQCFSENAGD